MRKKKNYWAIIFPSIFFIAAIVVIMYLVFNQNISVSNDILVVLLTAILGGYGWVIKNEFDKRREIERREYELEREHDRLTYETRRQSYERLLQPFINMFSSIGGGQINQTDLKKQMREAGIKLYIYGSDEVIIAFNRFNTISKDIENLKIKIQNTPQKDNNQQSIQSMQTELQALNYRLIVGWANLIVTIRKSTGFPETHLDIEGFLKSFITDFAAHADEIREEIINF
jgi:Ca2+/Na+ antiporter